MTTERLPARAGRPVLCRAAATACGLALAAAAAQAQPGAAARGPYERARLLVESGRGAAGRLLADSLVARSTPGSPARAEALWWRAALAADGTGAERDLRRLIGEVPASPRAGAATVRLAQLALVRDRPEEAAALLDPLVRGPARGAPDPFARPQAAYWLARARLERRDVAGACAALDSAAAVGATALEPSLVGQIASLRRRVPGCIEAPVAVAAASSAPQPTVAQPIAPPTSQPPVAPRPTAAPPVTAAPVTAAPAVSQPPVAIPPGPVPGPPAESSRASTPAPRPTPPPRAAPAQTSVPVPAPSVVTAPAIPAFAIQVAAYDTRAGAEALAARLRATGLDARAEGQGAAGDAPPFRIKVGRYPTRAAAAAALRELRARGLAGFVTTAGGRP